MIVVKVCACVVVLGVLPTALLFITWFVGFGMFVFNYSIGLTELEHKIWERNMALPVH
jgi:hypothetical protein